MPDIGVPELLIIAVIVVLLFGPGKAADLGGSLGKSIREFRRASSADDDAPKDHPSRAEAERQRVAQLEAELTELRRQLGPSGGPPAP